MINDMILKGHDLFGSLNVDEIDRVSTFSSVKEFGKGDIIFESDLAATHFYILMDGLVYLQLPGDLPEFSIPISRVEKGELFGISPLLGSPRYTSTAQCYKDTKVLEVEAAAFRELLQQNASAGLGIITRVGHIYFTRYLGLVRRLQRVAG